jgi:hypothetical protein
MQGAAPTTGPDFHLGPFPRSLMMAGGRLMPSNSARQRRHRAAPCTKIAEDPSVRLKPFIDFAVQGIYRAITPSGGTRPDGGNSPPMARATTPKDPHQVDAGVHHEAAPVQHATRGRGQVREGRCCAGIGRISCRRARNGRESAEYSVGARARSLPRITCTRSSWATTKAGTSMRTLC